ncbi:MAG: hypothetical protein ABIU06_11860 [Anaerolineales bacterium]
MKTKIFFTVLLVTIIFVSCSPVAISTPTSLPPSAIPTSFEVLPESNWKTYNSEIFGVTLKYPEYWELDNNGNAVYSGQDGFFQISASSMAAPTAKEVCKNDVQANNSGRVNNYGTNPTMEILHVDRQPACLVIPADDQPREKREASLLVVEYPKSGQEHTRLLFFFADKNHIRDFISTLKFVR